jgi:carbonic anhydrase/acetyltransferase-like protein (isoleucine patch superfamily)
MKSTPVIKDYVMIIHSSDLAGSTSQIGRSVRTNIKDEIIFHTLLIIVKDSFLGENPSVMVSCNRFIIHSYLVHLNCE